MVYSEAARRRYGLKVEAGVWCLVLMLLAMASAWADIYKWVDDKGVVHFSDEPPVQQGTKAGVESMPSSPPSTWQPPEHSNKADAPPAQAEPPPIKRASPRTAQVELYVTSWCKYCRRAKDFLRSKGIPFTEYDIEKDPVAAKRRQSIDNHRGVPLAVINGRIVLGFSEDSYLDALNSVR